jgi:hypothetical protein
MTHTPTKAVLLFANAIPTDTTAKVVSNDSLPQVRLTKQKISEAKCVLLKKKNNILME